MNLDMIDYRSYAQAVKLKPEKNIPNFFLSCVHKCDDQSCLQKLFRLTMNESHCLLKWQIAISNSTVSFNSMLALKIGTWLEELCIFHCHQIILVDIIIVIIIKIIIIIIIIIIQLND